MTGLLALAFLLAFGCAETPEDPDSNRLPHTFISSYSINTAPESGTNYDVTVYWRGSDLDGEPAGYRYWVGAGDTTETTETSATVSMDFPNTTTTYVFYAQAKDNMNEWDATAAQVVVDITEVRDITDPAFLPNTIGVTVPPNGASTSRGVPFAISGTDVDGIVPTFEWAVDNTDTWTSVVPDVIDVSASAAAIVLGPADLSLGAHTVYFRATDNMGNVDPSPVSVAIVCVAGFAPELTVSVTDGQSFIVPYTNPSLPDFTISFAATVDFYYGQVDSFVVITSAGDSLNTSETELNLGELSSGSFWVDVTTYDAAGNSTASGQINFSIVELPAGDGILCVNGVDWPTYSQAGPMWTDGVPWGNRTHFKTWDLFDSSPIYSGTDFGDSLLGKGGGVPAWMIDTVFFKAISWFGNNYSGDFAYWEDIETEIIAYLEMGGNILLPARYGADWFFDDLATYCGIVAGSWESPGADILTAKVGTLTDILEESGQSLWEIPMTDNPDNLWIYEAATVTPGGHAGFITLPNGNGGGGGFCYIAGRSYRWDNPSLKANVDVILNTYFGIQ